jgi:hypothetical protein
MGMLLATSDMYLVCSVLTTMPASVINLEGLNPCLAGAELVQLCLTGHADYLDSVACVE